MLGDFSPSLGWFNCEDRVPDSGDFGKEGPNQTESPSVTTEGEIVTDV